MREYVQQHEPRTPCLKRLALSAPFWRECAPYRAEEHTRRKRSKGVCSNQKRATQKCDRAHRSGEETDSWATQARTESAQVHTRVQARHSKASKATPTATIHGRPAPVCGSFSWSRCGKGLGFRGRRECAAVSVAAGVAKQS